MVLELKIGVYNGPLPAWRPVKLDTLSNFDSLPSFLFYDSISNNLYSNQGVR